MVIADYSTTIDHSDLSALNATRMTWYAVSSNGLSGGVHVVKEGGTKKHEPLSRWIQ